MFFYLIVLEFEYLEAFWESSLGCFSFKEVINYSLVRVSLLDISIFKVNDGVAVLECFSSYTICENYFFLAV